MEESPVLQYDVDVRPTRVRFGVVAFTVALALVLYLDRVCISTLSGDIRRDLNISEKQMSYVFSIFQVAYALFEIPTAWWADRRGTRNVLARIVIWWSALTMVTAASVGYGMILIVRFLFGAGEAGALPCVTSTFSRWIPATERGRAQSFFFAGSHMSGAFTPMLVIYLSTFMSWRSIFVLFGFTGFIWATAWRIWYRNDPSEHPDVNPQELEKIRRGRLPSASHTAPWEYWRKLLTNRNTLPLCLMYLGNCYAYYFCITWLPTYLQKRHGVTGSTLGLYLAMPLTLSIIGDFTGGITTDRLSKRFGLRFGRCALGAVGYALAACSMMIAATANNPVVAIIALSAAVALVMFTLAAAWGTCLDIGGHHAGVVGAIMNSAGNTGAIFSPIVAIVTKDYFHNWNAPLVVIGGLFVVGAISWCVIDPTRRVFD
jgi:MFS transporter, ACS family, glucarate transporter